jgi:SPP1 gp7 family putative phage head morphogenesis protein
MHLVERMQVAVIGLVNAYFDRLMREIEPRLRARFDAAPFPIGDVGGQVSLGEHFLQTTFRMVDRQAAEDLSRVIPVPSDTVLKGSAKLESGFIRNNTELIKLDQRTREEVRKVIEGPLREGIRVEEVRKLIEERLGVVRSRAELIARDQTTKLYGQIQQARQTEAGIVEYTWSTSEDERVRGTPGGKWPKGNHYKLDGTTQRWDSPPLVDEESGRHEHPGGDIQCRCAAIPILPLDGLEPADNPPEPADITPTEPGNDVTVPGAEEPPANDLSFAPPPANDLETELHVEAQRAAAERLATEQAALEAELQRLGSAPASAAPPPPPAPPAPPPPPPPSEPPSGPPPPSDRLASQEALVSHLETRGASVRVAPDAHQKLVELFGESPTAAQIDAILGHEGFAQVAGDRRIQLEVVGGKADFRVQIPGNGTYSEPDVSLRRTFRRERGTLRVHHDLLKLAEDLQGSGIGARVISAQLGAYEQLGVTHIDLDAAWVGRYYWPKLGFNLPPKRLRTYVERFRGYLQSKGLDAEVVARLTTGITSMREIATTDIGGQQLGKNFFLGEPLDPRDPKGERGVAAGGHFIEGLVIRVKPGDRVYEAMKREVGK